MPSDARGADLLSTPSSPRPSSSASSSTSSSSAHLPLRTTSMDSLPTTAAGEKVEHIPTRTVATGPKVNTKAMIFVKTGPAQLYKSAAEQMKKAQTVKDMRRLAVQEEEPEWQQSTSSRSAAAATHDDDWQVNLESWKKSRRKRNEDALERVIEVKKAENEKNRRMSSGNIGLGGKTGRRLNVVVHDDDDNNDLSDLGLSRGTSYPGVLTDSSNTDIVTSIEKQSKLNSSVASSTTTILDSPPSSLMIMSAGHHTAKTSSVNSGTPATATTAAINNKNRTTTGATAFKNRTPLATGFTTTTSNKYLLDNDNNNSTDNVNDNKDAKSDAGFCTGSDTGSDGLFPDDNISDTSSALGDKKEAHDSLLDAVVLMSKDDEVMTHTTGSSITSSLSSSITCSSLTKQETMEYTYDKAIEGYKQYAENSIKKRTSSMTSLNSISSGGLRYEDKFKYDKESSLNAAPSPKGPGKIGDKLDFFVKEMDKEFTKPEPKPLVIMREKSPKVDITKRRTMFEMGHSVSTVNLYSVEPKLEKRKSSDMTASTGNLKSKVASFESFEIDKGKQQGITPPRDTKFKEKLANFSTKPSNELAQLRKKVPEKDKNFHQKLASFTSLENADENKSMERKTSLPQLNTASLKSKIASFEQLDQQDNSADFHLGDGNQNQTREKSISMECLTRYSASRRHEAKLNRGSVEALDEEGPELSRKDHNWRPPRASRSPEKSKFSSKTLSFDETYSSSTKSTSISERRSQLHKSSSEIKEKDFKFRSEKQVDANKIKDRAPSAVSRILPSPKFVGQESSLLCPPLDLSSSQSEAPISTSSPRQDSFLNSSSFPQSTNTSKSLTTESLWSENKNESFSSSCVVTSSFSSSVASVISSSSSPAQADKSDSVGRYCQEDHYDDVLNTVESSSLRSSMESDRPHYTDDDINEVIDDLGSPVKPEVSSKAVPPPAKSVPLPRRVLPTVPTPSYAPPPPPASVDVQPAQVVIVDWSESGGPVAPPSEPPPPPPPDDDDNDSEAPQSSFSPPLPPSSSTGTNGPVNHGRYPSFEVPATSPTPSDCPSLVPSETYASSEGSRTSAKEQLRQRRSDFLGTSHVAAEPPLDALLQQQRAADRQMLETRRSLQLSTHQVLSDIDQSSSYRSQMLKSSMSVDAGKSLSRDRYTWEDRLRDDTTQPNAGLNDTDDGYGYHNKLEELEAEMMRHDRAVLSRTRSQQSGTTGRVPDSSTTGTQQAGTASTTSNSDNKMESSSSSNGSARAASPTYDDVTVQSGELAMYDNSNTAATTVTTATSVTEQQHDDCYYEDNIVQQQQVHYNQQNTQQSPPLLQHHKQHQQEREELQELQSLSYQAPVRGPEKPIRTYNPCYDSNAPVSAPEVLLRKKMPAPPPEEDNYEAVDPGQGQHMSKQSRQALSATPRTRLQQGESWIRRKAEQARDYNKHWLIQEAEQRRLEQRDRRISKGEARHDVATTTTTTSTGSSSSTSPHSLTSASSFTKPAPTPYHKPQPSTQSPHSNMNANATRTADFRSSEASVANRTSSSSSSDLSLNKALDPYFSTALPPAAGTRPQEPVNRTTDPNAWRNQATTYQPLPTPAPSNGWDSKPLPDSIISTLTARVQNRSRPGSANSSSGRPSPYSGSMGGSSGNLHYAANYPATTNGNAYTTDDNYHDYMNTDAINLQRQQQYQYQEQHQIINSENQQQPLYANYSVKTNTGSSASVNTEHYAQHHQTSPTTSLPLSSSSSSLSALQQQQQYHPHHNHQSPHPSPPQANNLVTSRNNNNNNNSNSKTSPMSSSSSSSVASSSKPKDQRLSVSGNKKCCHCGEELGRGAAMIIESLKLFYHIPCFVCCVCGLQLGNGESGADVRVRNHALHCHNCYSNDQGMKFSEV